MDVLNFIDGAWQQPTSPLTLEVRNPATAEVLTMAPAGSALEVAAAVEAASRALPEWSRVPVQERVQFLFTLRNRLREDLDGISR
ncbi:MAG TPA: aldehyde dehydrogenase family protein, partial [Anaerolineales bacterium]|nr:aldehyde dehydrogenase family protein [Anaerolineales bacterium]